MLSLDAQILVRNEPAELGNVYVRNSELLLLLYHDSTKKKRLRIIMDEYAYKMIGREDYKNVVDKLTTLSLDCTT